MTPAHRFLQGALIPWRGLQIIFSSRKMFSLSMLPFLIGLLCIIGSVVVSVYWVVPWMGDSLPSFDMSQTWMGKTLGASALGFFKTIFLGLLLLGTYLSLSIFAFVFGYMLIILVSGPFFALLAEEIFKQKTSGRLSGESWGIMFSMLWVSLLKLFLFTFVGIICFVFSFIPGVGFLAPIPLYLMVAFDCMDYSFEVDKLSLRRRFLFFMSHLWEFFGLTAMIYVMGLLAGAFFILLPAFICGATDLYVQLTDECV